MKKSALLFISAMLTLSFVSACTNQTTPGGDNGNPGQPSTPVVYNVAQALAAAKGLGNNVTTTSEYSITGTVSSYYNVVTGTSGDFRFAMVTSDTSSSEKLIVYYAKPNGFALPKGGDTITVVGKLQNFYNNNSSTYEVVNSKITALTSSGNTGGGTGGSTGGNTGGETEGTNINVSQALTIGNALTSNETTTVEYKVSGYVWSGFNPKIGDSGDYQFDIVDNQSDTKFIIAYYVKPNGFALPNKGDAVTVSGKILKYVSGSSTKIEITEGKMEAVTSNGGETGGETEGTDINVAQALTIGNALANNAKTSVEYKVSGYVWSGFEPSTGSSGDFKFDMVDEDEENADFIIAYYVKANGFELPNQGDYVTVSGKITKYVSGSKTYIEVVEGKLEEVCSSYKPIESEYDPLSIFKDIFNTAKESDPVEEDDYIYDEETSYLAGWVDNFNQETDIEAAVRAFIEFMPDYLVAVTDYYVDHSDEKNIDYGSIDFLTDDEVFIVYAYTYIDPEDGLMWACVEIMINTDYSGNDPIDSVYSFVSIFTDIFKNTTGNEPENDTDYSLDETNYVLYGWTDFYASETDIEAVVRNFLEKMPEYLTVIKDYYLDTLNDETTACGCIDLETDDQAFTVYIYSYIGPSDNQMWACVEIYYNGSSSEDDTLRIEVISAIALAKFGDENNYNYDESDDSYWLLWDSLKSSLSALMDEALQYVPIGFEEFIEYTEESDDDGKYAYVDYVDPDYTVVIDISVFDDGTIQFAVYTYEGFLALYF